MYFLLMVLVMRRVNGCLYLASLRLGLRPAGLRKPLRALHHQNHQLPFDNACIDCLGTFPRKTAKTTTTRTRKTTTATAMKTPKTTKPTKLTPKTVSLPAQSHDMPR